ncbi:MAG TPA: antitoxin Xre/MbcA/ParS toxin-binding domain-containing protein [Abditibacterium sp.]|jgi:putative toxin-antitoxin system antitoxin component (TIGR02293 family)
MATTLEKPSSLHSFTELLGLTEQNSFELMNRVETGLPFSAFEALQRAIGVPATQLAAAIVLPPSTLARNKKSGRLGAAPSERLVRLARLTDAAIALFEGDEEKARRWMKTSRAVLNGKTPLELAATELGAREVENLIWRLEDGVFS